MAYIEKKVKGINVLYKYIRIVFGSEYGKLHNQNYCNYINLEVSTLKAGVDSSSEADMYT
jgi:hypothetical protein